MARQKIAATGPRKSIAFTDFYEIDGQRCGSVQSTGFSLGYGEYLMHLYSLFDRSAIRRLAIGSAFAAHTSLATVRTAAGRGTIFVCLIEDMPYPENRVVLDDKRS